MVETVHLPLSIYCKPKNQTKKPPGSGFPRRLFLINTNKKKILHPGRCFTKPTLFMVVHNADCIPALFPGEKRAPSSVPSISALSNEDTPDSPPGYQMEKWNASLRRAFTPPWILNSLLPRIYPQQVISEKQVEKMIICVFWRPLWGGRNLNALLF